jgi:hypothetical protein
LTTGGRDMADSVPSVAYADIDDTTGGRRATVLRNVAGGGLFLTLRVRECNGVIRDH